MFGSRDISLSPVEIIAKSTCLWGYTCISVWLICELFHLSAHSFIYSLSQSTHSATRLVCAHHDWLRHTLTSQTTTSGHVVRAPIGPAVAGRTMWETGHPALIREILRRENQSEVGVTSRRAAVGKISTASVFIYSTLFVINDSSSKAIKHKHIYRYTHTNSSTQTHTQRT